MRTSHYLPLSESIRFDYVLVKGQWFLHCNNVDATNQLAKARRFKTWESANERALGTSWKFCQVGELE